MDTALSCTPAQTRLGLEWRDILDLSSLRTKSHRLVVFALPDHVLSLSNILVHVRREKHPQLPPAHDGVPSTCAKRVNVHGRTGTFRANQKPPVTGTMQ